MDEDEYDPFADEFVDGDQAPSWSIPKTTTVTSEKTSTPPPPSVLGEKRKISSVEALNGDSFDGGGNSTTDSIVQLPAATSSAASPKIYSEVITEEDKVLHAIEALYHIITIRVQILWKSCWAYVKKFLRPYEDDGII